MCVCGGACVCVGGVMGGGVCVCVCLCVQVSNNKKEFRVKIDVQHFRPGEISIMTKGNRLIIHARHEARQDEHGSITREFTRQYVLPRVMHCVFWVVVLLGLVWFGCCS